MRAKKCCESLHIAWSSHANMHGIKHNAIGVCECRTVDVASIFALCSYYSVDVMTSFRRARVAIICLSVAVFLSEIYISLNIASRTLPGTVSASQRLPFAKQTCRCVARAVSSQRRVAPRADIYPVCLGNGGADVRG